MSQEVLRVAELPEGALDAAAAFHREWTGQARAAVSTGCGSLVIVLPPARYDHADWRRTAAHDLAREAAPVRVNILASNEEPAIAAALAFLESAPGITGQYLPLGGQRGVNAAD